MKAHLRENSRLKAEVSHERDRVLWLTLACVLGAALLIWAGIYLVLSHRLHVRRRAVDSHQITTLIENQKMLIRIGQSTDDIALALGISRASVNSARYRIRKKMGLGKEESLDNLVNSL